MQNVLFNNIQSFETKISYYKALSLTVKEKIFCHKRPQIYPCVPTHFIALRMRNEKNKYNAQCTFL